MIKTNHSQKGSQEGDSGFPQWFVFLSLFPCPCTFVDRLPRLAIRSKTPTHPSIHLSACVSFDRSICLCWLFSSTAHLLFMKTGSNHLLHQGGNQNHTSSMRGTGTTKALAGQGLCSLMTFCCNEKAIKSDPGPVPLPRLRWSCPRSNCCEIKSSPVACTEWVAYRVWVFTTPKLLKGNGEGEKHWFCYCRASLEFAMFWSNWPLNLQVGTPY
jgi:hypothetical protein